MKLRALSCTVFAALLLSVCASDTCQAQRDPETAARQAEIDADEARSKIDELQRDQIAAADVQNEDTAEMAARDRLIDEYADQEGDAERRLRAAERREED